MEFVFIAVVVGRYFGRYFHFFKDVGYLDTAQTFP